MAGAAPGAAVLTMVDGDRRDDVAAVVVRSEAPTVLEYTWGDDLLRWELAPSPTGTTLTLSHTTDDPGMLSKAAAGWHLCLVVADRLLDGSPIAAIRGQDAFRFGWQRLEADYAARLDVDSAADAHAVGRTLP